MSGNRIRTKSLASAVVKHSPNIRLQIGNEIVELKPGQGHGDVKYLRALPTPREPNARRHKYVVAGDSGQLEHIRTRTEDDAIRIFGQRHPGVPCEVVEVLPTP